MLNAFARTRYAAAVACVFLVACDGKESQPVSSSVRTDSSGVEIVTGPAADEPFQFALNELFRIGGNDSGPGSFSGAYPSMVGTDGAGRIYVLDSKQHRVEVFDSTGNHIRFVGQRGGGPGELQRAAQLYVLADGTIGVSDYGKRAIVRWAGDGTILPEYALDFFPSNPLRLSADSLLYVDDAIKEQQRTQSLRIATPRDTTHMTALSQPTTGMIMFSCIGLNVPPMFSPSLVWTGTLERLATSQQVPYVVDVFQQGKLVRSVRRPITTQAPTVEHVNRLHPEGMQIRFDGGACTVPAAELLEKQGVAARLPLVEALQIDQQGRLWVQRYGIREEPRSVDLFSPDGDYLGTLTGKSVPLAFIGNSIVLFGEPDSETGVVQIVAYTLSPLPAPN